MLNQIKNFIKNEEGAGVVEYVLIAVVASGLILAAAPVVSGILKTGMGNVSTNFANAQTSASQTSMATH